MKPRLLRKRYFAWLVVPAALLVLDVVCGLPHLCVEYSWIDEGQGYDPFARRTYTDCVFYGPFGRFDFHPADGTCAWLRFYKRKATSHAG